ncbi:histidine kinase [Dyadobacter chenwenxiniae]|uniref:Histidine kinase n=1 Tax=Dyadobacter chenwenxiniae TaxID=2906456 RepID=A0A9X1TEJ6_9BACT|nr:histidine kinase [Dyadobacter chenwenxiniae]MCF0063251.1 histidine kinase [Dyadobacter chenwenxiniae]UON85368.1 histidine kinase [Dyadobacter chenwenxiniae]
MMKHLESFIGKVMASRTLLHLSFCLAFVGTFSFAVVLSGNLDAAGAAMISCLYILTCTYVGRWYGKSWLNRSSVQVLVSKSVLIFLTLVLGGAAGAAYMFKGNVAGYFLQNLFICFPISLLFVFFGIAIALARHTLAVQVTEAKIAQEQKESELRLLLSQLSPHFLFNTLNNIYGISLTQQQRVPSLLLKLSELLRYSVYETREDFILLENELLYLKNYIDFEKIQNGDRLMLELAIEENPGEQIRIAPMLLIVFVENAFKHSKSTRKPSMLVAITLRVLEGWICCAVKNSFDPDQKEQTGFQEPSGIGLHHTLKRLNLIYGSDYFYNATHDNGTYHVELRLKAK